MGKMSASAGGRFLHKAAQVGLVTDRRKIPKIDCIARWLCGLTWAKPRAHGFVA